MDARATLDALAAEPELAGRLVYREVLPARDARLRRACRAVAPTRSIARLESRGIDRLFTHQAAAIDRLRAGTSVVVATGTASGKSLCYQLPIVDSVVAGEPRHRAADLPDQGARAGPAAVAAVVARARPARGHLRRRHRTATTAPGPARTRTSCSPTPRCCTWASSRRTSGGRRSSCGCATSCRRAAHACAASSAARSRTCCAACSGCASTTAPRRRSASRARRSATRASSHRRCAGCRSTRSTTTAHRAPSACSAAGNDRCSTSTRARAGRRTSRPPTSSRGSCAPGHQTLAFTRSRRERRARRRARAPAPGSTPTTAAARRPACRRRTAPATCPRSGASSNSDLSSGRLLGHRGDERARARHRRRRPRRGHPQRLPRDARVDVAAGRAGRAHRPAVGGGPRRRRRPARPVVCRAPARADPPPARARGREPAEPVRAARPGRVRGARAAARARRRALVRRRARRRGARPRARRPARSHAAGRCTGAGERPPAPEVGLRTGSSVEYRLVDRDEERTIGTVDDARVFAVAHPGAVYLHQGRQYRVDELDIRDHVALLARVRRRRRVHAAPHRDRHRDRRRRPLRTCSARPIVHLGAVEVRNQVVAYQRKQISTQRRDRGVRARPARACARDAGVLVHGAGRRRRGGGHHHRRS